MIATKTKLEVLEEIVKSDEILATEKVCIISNVLPKEIKNDILIRVTGMLDMAELLAIKKLWEDEIER